MSTKAVGNPIVACLILGALALLASPVVAANAPKGTLTVDGKPVQITNAYAYFENTYNDGKVEKVAVVVVLSDGPVPDDAVQNEYLRKQLVEAGKLNYVELLVGSDKKAMHYEVQHKRFGVMMQPGGDDSDHVVETTTLDATTIAGRTRTASSQMSPDDVPYSYDISFSAPIAQAKQP